MESARYREHVGLSVTLQATEAMGAFERQLCGWVRSVSHRSVTGGTSLAFGLFFALWLMMKRLCEQVADRMKALRPNQTVCV